MERLIVFTRYPIPGKTKTRLIPAVGTEGAANLQRQMTEHTLKQVRELLEFRSISVEIHFTGRNEKAMRSWLGLEWNYFPQAEGGLGERLIKAFTKAFADKMQRVVIIGIDCPELNGDRLAKAFDSLLENDLILGEANDGGYYLIGLHRHYPQLFQEIPWGTAQVFQKTVKIAETLGCKIATLPILGDVDYPEDLEIWYRVMGGQ